MDKSAIRGIAEDYWRAMIPLMQAREIAAAQELGEKFEQRIQKVADSLAPLELASFLQAMDAEREKLIAEYKADPYALKQRLGTPQFAGAPAAQPHHGNGGLGNLVVRTAVRATVWEAIWAIFRGFR